MVLIREDNQTACNTAPAIPSSSAKCKTLPDRRRGNELLKGVERANTVCLWQAVVLAPMDDEHRCLPFVHKVDRVELLDHFLSAGLPRASSPLVVELTKDCQCCDLVPAGAYSRRRAHQWSTRDIVPQTPSICECQPEEQPETCICLRHRGTPAP